MHVKQKLKYSAHVYVTLYYVYIYIIWHYDRSSCMNANRISTFLSLSHVRTQGAHEHESDEQRRCVKVQTHRCHLMTQKFAHQLQAAGEVCSLLAIPGLQTLGQMIYFPETNPVFTLSMFRQVPHFEWQMGNNLPFSDMHAELVEESI